MRGTRGTWLALGLLAGALAAPCQAQSLPSYLRIDGRYYGVGPEVFEYYPELRALVITNTTALSCHRANGGAVTPFGLVLYYSPSVSELQINSIAIDVTPPVVVNVTTVNADVVCLGEVAAPAVVDPNVIFESGFE